MNISKERTRRIQNALKNSGLDALICRVTEHVLYFTGYWPRNHVGAAVIPAEGRTVLLLSELEAERELPLSPPSQGVEVMTFPLESATLLRGPNEGLAGVLPGVLQKLGLQDGVIGFEQSLEVANVAMFQGEVKYPSTPTWRVLETALPRAQFKDATGVIMSLRAIKSEEEVQAIRLAVETASFGLAAAREALLPGMKETELASVVESAIHVRGTGYKGLIQARGYACVYTGRRSAGQWTHYAYSSDRKIEPDDIVIIELGSFADGYWADLTRNLCAGTPSNKACEMYAVALEAQKAAIDLARPGVSIPEMELAAREVMAKYGYAGYWPHGLGHGVGAAYHEGPPLHHAYNHLLEAGMVLTVEPGIYIDEVGGLRPEDIIVVRDGPADVLSAHIPHTLEKI